MWCFCGKLVFRVQKLLCVALEGRREWGTGWKKVERLAKEHNTKGDPLSPEFIYKKVCVYSYMFKCQSSSKYSLFDAKYLSRCFSRCSKQFWNLLILMAFSASVIFCFSSSTSAKCFPLRTFLIQGNKKKKSLGVILVNMEAGWIIGLRPLLVKNCWTLNMAGRCTCKPPIMKRGNALKVFQKEFTEAKCSLSHHHQLVHWHRWVPGTLTQQGKPVLQGPPPRLFWGFLCPSLYAWPIDTGNSMVRARGKGAKVDKGEGWGHL